MFDPTQPCPCGKDRPYADCCGRYHPGRVRAPTAVALMRSRYSAYVTGAIDYLVATTHPSRRRTDLRADYQSTHETIDWIGLEVLECSQGGEADKTGKVSFRATYRQGGRLAVHHEHARFRRHAGAWTYLDGQVTDSAEKEG